MQRGCGAVQSSILTEREVGDETVRTLLTKDGSKE